MPADPHPPLVVSFADGTVLIDGLEPASPLLAGLGEDDQRTQQFRAWAADYAAILRRLHATRAYQDRARAYQVLELSERAPRALRPYQLAALQAWEGARRRGVVVLPTGAGKTYVAVRAIAACQRSCLVLAPTIDLVQQWAAELERSFGVPIGQYGGGEKRLEAITVATYDSAVLFMPWYGNRFGLLICDECHHLPAEMTRSAALHCLAPFRLGLTATPERSDGASLDALIGPEVHRSHIAELEGSFLASYQVEVVHVDLDDDELASYRLHRRVYLAFARSLDVDFSAPGGWQAFVAAAARDVEGRAALRAYREQKRLTRASRAKLRAVWQLIVAHGGERILIFTEDNDTAYAIGRRLVAPVLTHHTRGAERKAMLGAFRSGDYPVLITSKVLNEGIDVPEASVGIIVSGSGSVREHVQRLGRILRPQPGKRAVLYEILSANTAEAFTSERRRSHAAFGAEPAPPC